MALPTPLQAFSGVPKINTAPDKQTIVDGEKMTGAQALIRSLEDLGVEDVPGEPVLGDAVAHHAAGLIAGVVDLHLMAKAGQVVGRGQSRGAGADHDQPPAVIWRQMRRHAGGRIGRCNGRIEQPAKHVTRRHFGSQPRPASVVVSGRYSQPIQPA